MNNQVVPTEWTYVLGQAAVEAVKAEWELRGLYTMEERAAWVEMILGTDIHDRDSKCVRPFMWAATDSLTWDGEDPNTCGVSFSF